jgi:anti-sigma factor RsiW
MEFVELVTDYVEGALSEPTMSQMEEHLVMCDWCVDYLGQLRSTIAALAALRSGAVDAGPRESTLAALRARKAATS